MTEEERKELEQLRKDNEDYQRSFELFHRGTQALHATYPHPDPLTWRDLGQTCRMAAEEVRLSRKAIWDAMEILHGIKNNNLDDVDFDEGIDKVIQTLKSVAGEDLMRRLEYLAWKPHPGWVQKGEYWFLYLKSDAERHDAYIYKTSAYHNEKVWTGTIEGHSIDFQVPTREDAMREVESVLK